MKKRTKKLGGLSFGLLIGVASTIGASAQTYSIDTGIAPTVTYDSTVGGSGTMTFTYNRTSGTSGPSTFTQDFSFTSLGNPDFLWSVGGTRSGLTGLAVASQTFWDNMPTSNQVNKIDPINGDVQTDLEFTIDNTSAVFLGSFTVTMDSVTVPGLSFVSGQHDVASNGNERGILGGYIAIPTGGTLVAVPTNAVSETQRFGATDALTFDYTAVAPGDPNLPNGQNRPMFGIASSELVFTAVPEPSSVILLGLSSIGFLARRRRK